VPDRARSEAQPERPAPAPASQTHAQGPSPEPLPASGGPAPPTPAQALALQRAIGNRAAARTLARWAAHPDKDKKGQFLTDSAAAEYMRFNPPKNA
jgi:hypothetical protein